MKLSSRGFTILELLVVVAIIGILTALTYTLLSEGNRKARNEIVVSQMYEHQKAIELYYSTNGSYPHPLGDPSDPREIEVCLADSGSCWPGVNPDSAAVRAELSAYIPSFPYLDQGVVGGQANSGSPAYNGCTGIGFNDNSGGCGPADYSLFFLLEGTNEDCGGRAIVASANYGGGNHTMCRLMPGRE